MCESGHTHTTRRQIIQDIILQPQRRRETHKKTPKRRSRGAGMGESAEVLNPHGPSRCPLGEAESAAR